MHKNDVMQLGATVRKNGVFFAVWAPNAKSVSVTGSFNDWATTPMDSDDNGNWSVEIEGAEAGQEYKYVIDTGTTTLVKNDPRALQVETSAGNSIIVADEFAWEDKDFKPAGLNQQVIYELHVGTFFRPDPSMSGTFDSVRDKLDHLTNLGITTIELMPIASMSLQREWWGYTPDYIYAVEALYGGRRQLLELVNEAHKRGIGVILDVVYNHMGPDNSLDLWQFDGWSEDGKGGIYFYNDWRSKTPWGETRPDYGRTEVQDYILDNVAMWMVDCHLDGLRVDSTIFIRNAKGNNDDPDNDIAEGWHLLQRLNSLARKINPDALMIAEDVGANNYLTMPEAAGGAGFGAQWELSFPHAFREALNVIEDKNRNLDKICELLTRNYNGDAYQRVVYSDSHDTAANDGAARLAEEISPGKPTNVYARKRSLIAAAIVMSAPGIPMLLQGQEFMEGGSFNDWRGLDWEKAETFAGIVLAHRHLIDLRKNVHNNTSGLLGQHINILHRDGDNNVLAYHRWDYGGVGDDTLIVINFNNRVHEDYRIPFPYAGTWRVRFNSSWQGYSLDFKDVPLESVLAGDDTKAVIKLAPYSVLIFSQDPA